MALRIRRSQLPSIFARFEWVRTHRGGFVDCPSQQDQKLLHICAGIFRATQDVAELDSERSLALAIDIPESVVDATGTSDRHYQPTIYSWNLYDVNYLLRGTRPAEAVDIATLGLSNDDLLQLANNDRYLAFIRAFGKASQRPVGYYFPISLEKDLRKLEEQTTAQANLRRKLLRLKRAPAVRACACVRPTQKVRNEVLRFHEYTCIFDGKARSDCAIDVHHVIPRRLIQRLHLPESLLTARENLVAACTGCNVAKSDELHPTDVTFYLRQFASFDHPNHALVPLLRRIQLLQSKH